MDQAILVDPPLLLRLLLFEVIRRWDQSLSQVLSRHLLAEDVPLLFLPALRPCAIHAILLI